MVSWWLRQSRIHLQEIQVWSLELGRPQCSCLENSMDGRAWQATVHGVAESNMPEWQHFHFPGGKVPKLTNKAHKKLHFSLLIALRKETCVKDGKKAQNIFFFLMLFPPSQFSPSSGNHDTDSSSHFFPFTLGTLQTTFPSLPCG